MAQRAMQISVIGCLNNCIREYNEKLRKLRQLLDDTFVQDEIEDEIKDYLGGSDAENMSVDEILDEFFDQEHGMIKIGTMFWKKQRFITLWVVVRTLRDVPPVEIRGFTPENLIGIFKSIESATRFKKEFKNEYGYLQIYPLIVEK